MTASLFLLMAVVLAFAGGGGAWIMPVTVMLAAAAGTTFPDLDQQLRLGHRSALSHGILPPLIALIDQRTWPVAAGLAFGIGLHLAADLFPSAMRGFATIKLPLFGSIGAGPSYLWIVANAAASLVGGAILLGRIANRRELVGVMAAVGVLGTAYLIRTDGGWRALAVFAVLGWLVFR